MTNPRASGPHSGQSKALRPKPLRIIAGHYRGRILKSPRGMHTRPTLGRVREALYNILAPALPGSTCLELFAGSGSMGLEALSRGCRRVVMVEGNRAVGEVLTANARLLDPQALATRVMIMDAARAVQVLAAAGEQFDFIFLDPPYADTPGEWEAKLTGLHSLLAAQGTVIFQHSRRMSFPETWAGCTKKNERCYGETTLTFLEGA